MRNFEYSLLITTALIAVPAAAQEMPTDAGPVPKAETPSPLDVGIEITGGYNDNIFATRNREEGDFVLLLRPSVRANLGSGDTTLSLRGESEIGRYADFTSEDYEDWLLAADGRAHLSTDLSLIGGAEWRWDHENRASPEAVSGLEPTQYQRGFGYLGLLASSGNLNGRLAGTVTRYDFDDVPTTGGFINNDDRDRWQGEAGARAGVSLDSGTGLFVQATYDWRDYDDPIDDGGYRRDSDGFSLSAGVRGTLGDGFSGEVFAGWLRQDYRDARLKGIETFDIGAVLEWAGRNGLGGSLRLDRSIEETTLPGASGFIATSGRLSLRNEVHPRLSAGVGLSGTHYEYVGDPRTEFVIGGDAWVNYWIARNVYLGASYLHAQRSSNAAGFDYDQNRFQLTVGARLRPGYSADAAPLAIGGAPPGGGYAGLLLGHGALIAGLDGPRGRGRNTADFGDHGAAAVAVVGYGMLFDSLYLGVEAEGSLSGPDWLHTADRVFSMDKRNAMGVAARLGLATPYGTLAYGRFGVGAAKIRTDYFHNVDVYGDNKRHLGLSAGLGIEAPAGRRGFIRAEYVVTSYDDTDVPTGGGDFDNFSASESQFRVGGGFRFGSPSAQPGELAPVVFAGPYIGLQIGHGSLVTSNQGLRSGGTAVDIDRASHGGLLGVFAGYGAVIRRSFLGLEVEADTSAINWNIERDPNGRIYSAAHDYSFGGAVRAGLLLGKSAMAYARVGAVRTRFDVPYEVSGTIVRSTDTRTGVRYGGGLEIGLGGRARLRADYTATQYDQYDIKYGTNTDGFDHSEALFRIGVVWRL